MTIYTTEDLTRHFDVFILQHHNAIKRMDAFTLSAEEGQRQLLEFALTHFLGGKLLPPPLYFVKVDYTHLLFSHAEEKDKRIHVPLYYPVIAYEVMSGSYRRYSLLKPSLLATQGNDLFTTHFSNPDSEIEILPLVKHMDPIFLKASAPVESTFYFHGLDRKEEFLFLFEHLGTASRTFSSVPLTFVHSSPKDQDILTLEQFRKHPSYDYYCRFWPLFDWSTSQETFKPSVAPSLFL